MLKTSVLKIFLLVLLSPIIKGELAFGNEVNEPKGDRVFRESCDLASPSLVPICDESSRFLVQSNDFNLPLETDILKEINRARTNPKEYAEWLESLKQYYDGSRLKLPGEAEIRTNKGLKVLEEAISFVREQSPLSPLEKSDDLIFNAKERVIEFTNNRRNRNLDNISYGKVTPEAIVMQLIVDEGFSDRRNRLAIFNPNYRLTGLACQNDSRYQQVCAIAYEVSENETIAETPETSTVVVEEEAVTSKKPESPIVEQEVAETAKKPELESVESPPKTELNTTPPITSVLIERTERGILETGDKTIPNDGSLYDAYPLEGKAGDSFIITVESQEFDTFLAIMDKDGNIIDQNDDISDRDSNSRLKVIIPVDGTYNVIVNAYDKGGKGNYVLTVRK